MKMGTVALTLTLVMAMLCTGGASGITFDIGTRIPNNESDLDAVGYRWYLFDTNCSVITWPGVEDLVSSVFDGDQNTGMDWNSGGAVGSINIYVYLPFRVFVGNVTVINWYNGSSCRYNFGFGTGEGSSQFQWWQTANRTFEIHNFVTQLYIAIDSQGTNQFNFQDVLFDYVPTPTTPEEMQAAIDVIFQKLEDLEERVETLEGQVEYIFELLEGLEGNVTNLNVTQQEIMGGITNIWETFDALNQTIVEMEAHHNYLNISHQENVTMVRNDLVNIQNDLTFVENSVLNLTSDMEVISELKETLNQTIIDIAGVQERLATLEGSIPDAYDDSALLARIAELESENAGLEGLVGNMTGELESCDSQIASLESDVGDLRTEVDQLKAEEDGGDVEPDDEKEGGDDDDEGDQTLVIAAVALGVLGMLLGVVALMSSGRKAGKLEKEAEGLRRELEELKKATPPVPEPVSAPVEKSVMPLPMGDGSPMETGAPAEGGQDSNPHRGTG